jgi:hypothetical protein
MELGPGRHADSRLDVDGCLIDGRTPCTRGETPLMRGFANSRNFLFVGELSALKSPDAESPFSSGRGPGDPVRPRPQGRIAARARRSVIGNASPSANPGGKTERSMTCQLGALTRWVMGRGGPEIWVQPSFGSVPWLGPGNGGGSPS